MTRQGEEEASFQMLQAIVEAYKTGSFKALDAAIGKAEALEKLIVTLRGEQLAAAPTVANHGGDRRSDQVDKSKNVNLKGGNSAAYRLGVLKRDYPKVS